MISGSWNFYSLLLDLFEAFYYFENLWDNNFQAKKFQKKNIKRKLTISLEHHRNQQFKML